VQTLPWILVGLTSWIAMSLPVGVLFGSLLRNSTPPAASRAGSASAPRSEAVAPRYRDERRAQLL
jgi:hypothetical protein